MINSTIRPTLYISLKSWSAISGLDKRSTRCLRYFSAAIFVYHRGSPIWRLYFRLGGPYIYKKKWLRSWICCPRLQNILPYHTKHSQSDYWKAIVYSTVLFSSCAARRSLSLCRWYKKVMQRSLMTYCRISHLSLLYFCLRNHLSITSTFFLSSCLSQNSSL